MIHYIFLIDNSYSMEQHIFNIVNVVNNVIGQIKEQNELSYITIACFSNDIHWIRKFVNITYIDSINSTDFINPGFTALYDSVSNVILEFGINTEFKTNFYIITDGDDTMSSKYKRMDADYFCQAAIARGNWNIKHLDSLNYSTLSVPRTKINMDDISSLLENLKV